jgi:hypothetical protein
LRRRHAILPLGTPISALAHKRVMTKAVTQIRCGNMPCDILPPSSLYTPPSRPPPGVIPAHAGVTSTPRRYPCTRRRHVHPPASFLRTPPLRPPTGVIPVHAAVTSTPRRHPCTRRRHVHPRASSLYTPPSRPPTGVIPVHAAVTSTPGVIPAQAGILTRIALHKGCAVANNYAAIPSRHISYGKGDELRALKSLVWIRRICNSWRPCPD